MVALGRIERPVSFNSCDDSLVEHARRIELRDVRLCDVRLLGVCGEDRRAILSPGIGPLSIELRWIVDH